MAIHREPCYSRHNAILPETERIAENTIILPLYPSMEDDEVRHVIDNVRTILC